MPAGLDASDWNQIRAEYERRRREVVQAGQEYQARNDGQQMLARFDGRGFLVEPDGADWRWGLQLSRYGFAGTERAVTVPRSASADKDRFTYFWDAGVEEWFSNQSQGLEHGVTLASRPRGGNGPLLLDFTVRGGLTAQYQTDGKGVSFLDKTGGQVLHYAGLKAWDADGTHLPARLVAGPGSLRLEVDEGKARYPITIDPLIQQAFLKASNAGTLDLFGFSVAISGDTVLVGAHGERSSATGGENDDSAFYAGAAYVFVRDGDGWTQQAFLKASNAQAFDGFGWSVAISGDTAVVGAAGEDSSATGGENDNSAGDAGAAYVFVRQSGVWTQQAFLKASNAGANDRFGYSVAVSGDTVLVGATLEDSTVIGGANNNDAENAGAAYVFVRQTGVWTQQALLKASNAEAGDAFGYSVAISGDTAVIGAVGEDSLASAGETDNSASSAGAAYVFIRQNGTWTHQAFLKASNAEAGDAFGHSVGIDGETIVVGASGEDSSAVRGQQDNSASGSGAAYVFVRQGATWTQQAFLKASNAGPGDEFGISVAVSGDHIVVGARGEDSSATADGTNNSTPNSGAAYFFVRQGSVWTQQSLLKASNAGESDNFAHAVAIWEDTVVVGAPREASSATGGGNDNSILEAGAAYIFSRPINADLTIKKTAPASVSSGQEITYSLTVANNGPGAASGVVASDALPASTSFVSCATTKGECAGSGNNRSVNIGALDSGAEETVTLVASVACSLPDGSLLRNNASVTSATYDPNEGDNSDSVQTTVLNPAPVVQTSAGMPLLWPANHNLVNVALAASATDNCGTPNLQIRVYSNEADRTDTGGGAHSPDAAQIAPGTLRLRAERAGGGEGRVYLIVATATDSAGGVGVNAATVVVPKSQSAANVSAVTTQAAAARAYTLANSGNPPPGYIQVGTGPVLGPKQ